MSAATPTRLGQANSAGDVTALFMKVFAGEVLTAFETKVILKGLTRQRAIQSGKSASFPATYKASASYHTPGAEILGNTIPVNDVVISIDDLLISDTFIASIDDAMNHHDVSSQFSTELGNALALAYDKNVARNLIRAARGPALFTGDTGGSQIVDADGDTSATSLAGSIWTAKQTLEESDVDVDAQQVNSVLKPAQWYLLAQEPTLVLNHDIGGEGSYARGSFEMIGGVVVSKSNALPWGTDDSANSAIPADYRVDMSGTISSVFTEAATATVQLMGMAMESEYDTRRQGTLMVAKYAVGHGPLLNKCSVEIATAL